MGRIGQVTFLGILLAAGLVGPGGAADSEALRYVGRSDWGLTYGRTAPGGVEAGEHGVVMTAVAYAATSVGRRPPLWVQEQRFAVDCDWRMIRAGGDGARPVDGPAGKLTAPAASARRRLARPGDMDDLAVIFACDQRDVGGPVFASVAAAAEDARPSLGAPPTKDDLGPPPPPRLLPRPDEPEPPDPSDRLWEFGGGDWRLVAQKDGAAALISFGGREISKHLVAAWVMVVSPSYSAWNSRDVTFRRYRFNCRQRTADLQNEIWFGSHQSGGPSLASRDDASEPVAGRPATAALLDAACTGSVDGPAFASAKAAYAHVHGSPWKM